MNKDTSQRPIQACLLSITEASRILNEVKNTESALQQLLDYLITKISIIDTGVIWIHVPETGELISQIASGIGCKTLTAQPLTADNSLIASVLQKGKSKFGVITQTSKVLARKIPGLDKPGCFACLPLVDGSATYGVLTLLYREGKAPIDNEEKLFWQSIANLITLAIKNKLPRDGEVNFDVSGREQQQKAELISILAHEMRTPLTSIKGYVTALLMTKIKFNADKRREFLEIIDKECDVLQVFINDLLESAAIDSGALTLDLQPVKLFRLAGEAVSEIASHSSKHRFLVDFPEDFPVLNVDHKRIQQIFRHLLDNAIKYSPQGGLVVIQGRVRQEDVIVSVADEGVGISPEDLNRLFDKYFRAKSGEQDQIIGTGLGLPISRSIIEAHGGHMWAESATGHGSIFYFTIPYNATADT